MTIDNSGNLGLGVTPSAANIKTFEIGAVGNTLNGIGGGDIALMSNAYYNSGFKYAGSNLATSYRQQDGVHKWNIAASGTAGNTITFTQAMTLDANGNLGVGISSSIAARVHAYSSTTMAQLTVDGIGAIKTGINFASGGTVYGQIYFDNTSPYDMSVLQQYSSGALRFGTNNIERMRIDSSGNVGINTSTPQTALHLIGNMTMGDTTYSRPVLKSTYWGYHPSYRVLMIGSTSTNYTTQHTGAVTVAFNYDPSGNANGSFSGDGREILFRRGTQFVTPNAADTSYNLYNLVLLDGNVGIGTASPAYKLDVNGTSIFRDTLNFGSGAVISWTSGYSDGTTQTFLSPSGGSLAFLTNNTVAMFIKSNQNVGIGTTNPNAKLTVGSAVSTNLSPIAIFDSTGNKPLFVGQTGGNLGVMIGHDGNDIQGRTGANFTTNGDLTINRYGGNVGIGTTNPGEKLHVEGALRVLSNGSARGIYIKANSANSGNIIQFEENDGTQLWEIVGRGYSAAYPFYIYKTGGTGSGYRYFINSSGNHTFTGDVTVTGTITESSSKTIKQNINPITDALSLIKNITGYTYDRKDGTAKNQSGLIAEEIVQVLPGVVSYDVDGNPSGVQYTKIIAYLVESIKELKSELDSLKK